MKISKRFWVRILFLERATREYEMLVKDLLLFDHEYFFGCFRMDPTKFEQLLSYGLHHISINLQKYGKSRALQQRGYVLHYDI